MRLAAAQEGFEIGVVVKEVVDVKLGRAEVGALSRSRSRTQGFQPSSVGSGSLPIGDTDPAGLVNQTRAIRGRTARVVACTSYASGCCLLCVAMILP